MNKIRDRWRFVAESWFALSAEDQKEALAVAAAESGWPAYLPTSHTGRYLKQVLEQHPPEVVVV